jgi:hypothetical protein
MLLAQCKRHRDKVQQCTMLFVCVVVLQMFSCCLSQCGYMGILPLLMLLT